MIIERETTDYADYADLIKTVLIKPCASLYCNQLKIQMPEERSGK
jgi:hypothetical protein